MLRHLKLKIGKSNKYVFFRIDDEKLLEKYKTIWIKIEYKKY